MTIKSKIRKLALMTAILLAVIVAALVVLPRGSNEMPPQATDLDPSRNKVVAVFGATGTVGDGLLKTATS